MGDQEEEANGYGLHLVSFEASSGTIGRLLPPWALAASAEVLPLNVLFGLMSRRGDSGRLPCAEWS